MKKVTLCLIILILWSCSNSEHITEFIYLDSSNINGQLDYTANPLAPEKDTILCLNNVFIGFTGFDSVYCSYVRDLLSSFGGRFTECQFHNLGEHNWEYLAESKQCFYPVCRGQFISVIDPNTGLIVDSVDLNNCIIYPKRKRDDGSNHAPLVMGDFVLFWGNDHMNPKFITDTVTSSGEQIICFDALSGPHER